MVVTVRVIVSVSTLWGVGRVWVVVVVMVVSTA